MAAQNGHVKAAFYLGKYYQEGKGTQQDYSEALHWLTFAKNNGDLDAKRALEQGASVNKKKSTISKKYMKSNNER